MLFSTGLSQKRGVSSRVPVSNSLGKYSDLKA
jgi:hypothetical protein